MNVRKKYTFKKHRLSDSERLWISEAATSETSDPRVLKVRLRGRIPNSFQPASIDPRFYNDHGITPLGIWILNQDDQRLVAMDKTIRGIRDCIIESPGIEKFASSSLAQRVGLSEGEVAVALHLLGLVGRFWSSATGVGAAHTVVTLNGRNDYDEYLAYENLDELFEKFYVNADPNRSRIMLRPTNTASKKIKATQRATARRKGGVLLTIFDEYTISNKLGEGGAGSVFEATDSSGKVWAIKILDPSKLSMERRKRLKNEVAFCQDPPSNRIVRIVDSGILQEKDGSYSPFYVMQKYAHSLRKIMQKGVTPQVAFSYFVQILEGLEAAHLRKVIHRDIKPENILVSEDEKNVVIADFGIAHFEEDDLVTAIETQAEDRLSNFVYASPEQAIRGSRIDHRTDIYSLGLILNELFTGEVPRGAGYKTIGQVAREFAYLDAIITTMLQQQVARRIDSIERVKNEVDTNRGAHNRQASENHESMNVEEVARQVAAPPTLLRASAPSSDETSVELSTKIFDQASSIARANDLLALRQLIRSVNASIQPKLSSWRAKYDQTPPRSDDTLIAATSEGVSIFSPLIAASLASICARRELFSNQVATFEEILFPKDWNRAGMVVLTEMPEAAAYIYQALHGAACIQSAQLTVAMRLVNTKVQFFNLDNPLPIWKNHKIMGWPRALPDHSKKVWNVLLSVSGSWQWVLSLFGDETELKTALAAYYMALNILDYTDVLATNREAHLSEGQIRPEIPLNFVHFDNDIGRRAYRLLMQDVTQVKQIWSSLGITDARFAKHWEKWLETCAPATAEGYLSFPKRMPHSNLAKDLIGA